MTQGRAQCARVHASLLRRALASCIDAISLGLILFVILAMIQVFLSAVPMKNRGPLLLVILSFVGLCYGPGMESSATMGTLGKRICGIEVADMSGGRISGPRALARNLLKTVFVFLFPVSVVMIVKGTKKQSLHDWLAGTQVLLRP